MFFKNEPCDDTPPVMRMVPILKENTVEAVLLAVSAGSGVGNR